MNRPLALLVALTIVGGLVLDQFALVWGQAVVNVWAWGVMVFLLWRSLPAERIALLACLLIATLGEVVLSLVWGLYDYRLQNIPLFVPPGHVLLYALGLWCAQRLPQRLLSAVVPAAILLATVFGVSGSDQFSVALTGIFLLAMRYGPAPRLYATMFVLSLLMELWGTWLGNWTWRATVPGLGWTTLNPPFAAGAFYCLLDWLVGLATRRSVVADQRA
ncbi:MAG TPA: hypothetical protein PLW86_05750 [Rhodocyclaceae bacterium]|nr:hypothetical protein [Rhodocyclaceae bacterium]